MKGDLIFREGYCKALMDAHNWFACAQAAYKADRRNNIQHVLWTLEGMLEDPDALMEYGDTLPMSMETAGKKTRYYVDFGPKGR